MNPVPRMPSLSITLLGAGQEVGRSCCVLQHRGKTVVCDAGVHPAFNGLASLPFIDALDWSTVDAILITHFHLDHAAALTYIMEKTNFKQGSGKVYMTHATKAMYKFMMQDFVRMSSASSDALFTPQELSSSLLDIIPVSILQMISPCAGISFTPYPAGHVLGACMFHVDIAGLRILYTGDYSREEDRHLVPASIPSSLPPPHVLIVESTFGVHTLSSRAEKEARFLQVVQKTLQGGGHVLLPVLALGMAQELLLVLEEYWAARPELHGVPVYYASSLARKCMSVYHAFVHSMNENVQARFVRGDNPFVFKHVSHLPQSRGVERRTAEGPPCVVLASPAMLQSGTSRQLLELWAPDARNAIIITGSSVEGTLARDIIKSPNSITSLRGTEIPCKLSVHDISFSAHVDYAQNAEFIELVKAPHVVLVHGQQDNMRRLRDAMEKRFRSRGEDVRVHTPRNLEVVRLEFPQERIAKVLGSFAAEPGAVIEGLLVSSGHSNTIVHVHDFDMLGLSQASVRQRQRVAIGCRFELVRWHLEGMFGSVEEAVHDQHGGSRAMRVMGAVTVVQTREYEVALEWESNAANDMIADSVLALILGIDASPASVKMTRTRPHVLSDSSGEEGSRAQRVAELLEMHFGDGELLMPDGRAENAYLLVRLDKTEAKVYVEAMTVTSADEPLRERVEAVLHMALVTTSTLADHHARPALSPYAKAAILG